MFIVPFTRDVRDTRAINRLLDGTVERFFNSEPAARTPALDVAESALDYTVRLEVPGVAKEDVKVTVEGRRVSVQAQAAQPQAGDKTDKTDKTDKAEGEAVADKAESRIVWRERSATRYARSFTLPVEVDQGEANAKLENGVLTLTLPKRNARAAAQITIN